MHRIKFESIGSQVERQISCLSSIADFSIQGYWELIRTKNGCPINRNQAASIINSSIHESETKNYIQPWRTYKSHTNAIPVVEQRSIQSESAQ